MGLMQILLWVLTVFVMGAGGDTGNLVLVKDGGGGEPSLLALVRGDGMVKLVYLMEL